MDPARKRTHRRIRPEPPTAEECQCIADEVGRLVLRAETMRQLRESVARIEADPRHARAVAKILARRDQWAAMMTGPPLADG